MSLPEAAALADHQNAFVRHLHRRVEAAGRRLHRFLQDGWDINGLALLHEEASDLARHCARREFETLAGVFGELAEHLGGPLQAQALPTAAEGQTIWALVEQLGEALPAGGGEGADTPDTAAENTSLAGHAETPPAHYWRRWGDDAPPASWPEAQAPHEAHGESAATPEPAHPPLPAAKTSSTAPVSAPAEAVGAVEPIAIEGNLPTPRVYHLTQHGPLSLELDQRMEALGWEVELLDSGEELIELLGALPADLVIVDAAFTAELESFGHCVRQARLRSSQKVLLVAISEVENVGLRLSARRAGVDALIVDTGSANDVLKRLAQLLDPNREAPFRVLIVEDDRGQALFAEGVLRNANMETRVVMQALEVMPVLQAFQPDLILMDLHMPGADGIELTTLIREQDEFLHTPIVFLSGEVDADRQFDALDAGGDDFLAKPIRPRHLIASVQNRVRRHRALASRRQLKLGRDSATGLFSREELLAQVDELLARGTRSGGGVLFMEIESIGILRDKLGLSQLEQVLGETGRMLAQHGAELKVARFGDGSFLVLDLEHEGSALDALAAQLRNRVVQHQFSPGGHPLRLRAFVGVAPFEHRYSERGQLLNIVERMAREARGRERGLQSYVPSPTSELDREQQLLAEIRDAVAKQRLELLFQPVVAVAGGDESQYQVLLRLRQGDGKLIPAGQVVPLAERGDFIVDIDRWVVMRALELIRDRRKEAASLRLFVTQSSLTLSDSTQVAWLKTELVAHDVPGTALVIELRLDDTTLHAASLKQFCAAMVADGVQFCLSQYEHSRDAESLLEQLPLSYIKLARKYTGGSMSQSLRDDLKAIIDRAHRHGLEVIGHGVEDAQAAATLWMSGIDFIQGNLVQQADQGMEFDFQQAVL